MRTNLKVWLATFIFLLGIGCTISSGRTIYVDAHAAGNNDGSYWADAYNYLQDALAAASSGDKIWVAQGIYKPDQGRGIKSGDREATFKLKNGVAIYGGFPPGGGEWQDSNPSAHKTILNGDLKGDDIKVNSPADLPDEPTREENSYHVVTSSGTDETAVLDGFTITAGRSEGGGIFNDAGSPKIRNCFFSGHSSNVGSAMSNRKRSAPTLTNCTFSENWGRWGAMNNSDSSPILIDCTFTANSGEVGGAIDNSWSNPTFTNCMFSGNSATGSGGAMRNYYSSPTLTNCTFSENSTDGHGGAMYNFNGKLTLTNCIFSGNSARKFGGGMANSKAKLTLTNCTFAGDSATFAGGIHNTNRSNVKLTNCILWGNSDDDGTEESAQIFYGVSAIVNYCCIQGWTGTLGGTGNIGLDPLFVNLGGDNYRLLPDSPCIDSGDNAAVLSSVAVDLDGNPRLTDGNGDGTATVDMGAYEYGR